MALKIQFTLVENATLETIVFDASISEQHSASAVITDFPSERGSDFSDNIQVKPEGLRVEGFLSDFPLANAGRQQASSGGVQGSQRPAGALGRAKELLAKLYEIKDSGILITVETGLKTYTDMAISDITVPRDKTIAKGVKLTIQLRAVRVVETQTTQVTQRTKTAKAQPKVKTGQQPSKEDLKAKSRSLLLTIGESVVDGLTKQAPQ